MDFESCPAQGFNCDPLVRDMLSIWRAGVDAVTPKALMRQKVRQEGHFLWIDDSCAIDLSRTRRFIVVGAGKASAAMAFELYEQVFQHWTSASFPQISGWVNAPDGSFSGSLPCIQLHAARPEGSNLPTQAAIDGTEQILKLVSTAGPDDIVLCLISGGGSALLVSPRPGISLQDKHEVAQSISACGGDILQLNTVRRCLSQVKGGGLARSCTAGRMISLVISDILGDPLEMIASGPTVPDQLPDSQQALKVLNELDLLHAPKLEKVVNFLQHSVSLPVTKKVTSQVENIVLGNNADAVDAAGVRAVELGYRYIMQSARQPEGDVQQVAGDAAEALCQLQSPQPIDCWISGGEPTVTLPANGGGKGGRNQQLVLCLLEKLLQSQGTLLRLEQPWAFLSAGTDGEDGPTSAAGAWISSDLVRRLPIPLEDVIKYRDQADAYHFFELIGSLIHTGTTGTNVCDLRIAIRQLHQHD